MELMVESNFDAVFLGIETPDEESLKLTKKFQNTRDSLTDTIDILIRAGLRPMAGFIIGFDGEKREAGIQRTLCDKPSNKRGLPDSWRWAGYA